MIAVLLSTFNGAPFLPEQLDSIIGQSASDWMLLIRDDGSTDESQALCSRYAARDSRILMLPQDGERLGAAHSYGRLLGEALGRGARYVFLADQDDSWDPNKMQLELQLMVEREALVGSDVPLLVHTDLRVVRSDGHLLHPSFFRYQRIAHMAEKAMAVLLAQNFVTACSALANRALLRLALPFPSRIAMHDWWLAQCAAACGEILVLPRATVSYRQHSSNAVGARGLLATFRAAVTQRRRWWRGRFEAFVQSIHQSRSLAERLSHSGRPQEAVLNMVTAYCAAFSSGVSPVGRLRTIRRLGIGPQSRLRRLLYYTRVILAPRVVERS